MIKVGDILKKQRINKKISLEKAARALKIKKVQLEALENSSWDNLPEVTFIKGFLTNYSRYLSLDEEHILALFRREYDERKFQVKPHDSHSKKRFYLTPNKLTNIAFILIVFILIGYLIVQYFSVLSAPKLKINSPDSDLTTNVPYVIVQGETEKESTVAVQGEFVPVDKEGNFKKEIKLSDGQNIIEIIASRRLSPKTKEVRIVRLSTR